MQTLRYQLVILFFLSLFTTSAYAGEIKIVDSHGLVRALKVVKDKATITIKLQAPLPGAKLVRRDSIQGEMTGRSSSGDTEIQFDQVSDGVWELQGDKPAQMISATIAP